MRRVMLAGLLAGVVAAAGGGSALAWSSFCDWDPSVLIVTPAGNVVPVYASVWTSALTNVGLPVETYTTRRVYDAAGDPETAVDMTITVPAGLLTQFQVTDEVTTGLLGGGTVLARASGWSGTAVHLAFVLREP